MQKFKNRIYATPDVALNAPFGGFKQFSANTFKDQGPAPKLSPTPASIYSAPPALGEHTDQVLRDMLGYNAGRIAALHTAGAI